ncbi:ADP-ribosylation/Crystallin J1 [Moritella viscosa]|uniref:ADP-ribosylglycohydrolase family protein n=1 Tax=Moritella viscosa TaxID=80854 RepID=UPI00091C88A0|nr:ADP-ribosylglycohydrolase family protein [Moritella viscosa]SGY92300.1 ADP-ribosylation/Crystallin J1 [Moritella viscosa]SHO21322.1 ADP-ribosylation/Crystallin J1 [Moritella viscosa]
MTYIRENQIVNSALWAAYGDALGFITELASEKTLIARSGLEYITKLVPWKRKVGGMFGATINLPAGAYSDDTQLRLATSRSIRSNGHFAIQTFAKIELPVWQNYALGAGRSSKYAANCLSKPSVAWFSNFFESDKTTYIDGGGNGAVMRIQPHIWCARDLNTSDEYLLDVVKNSITTHGHPRAIAGAVFHAQALAYILQYKRVPSIQHLIEFNLKTLDIPRLISLDSNLETIWRPQFEEKACQSLDSAYKETHGEINDYIKQVDLWSNSSGMNYKNLAKILNLHHEKTRGSGTLTAIAASAALLLIDSQAAPSIFKDVVNELWTDTDSIATMLGAMIGILIEERPPETLQDEAYLIQDAKRLYAISQNACNLDFEYPSPMTWKSPVSLVDYITESEGDLIMIPFGKIVAQSEEYGTRNNKTLTSYYQWVTSSFGSSFLIKRRELSNIKATPFKLLQNNTAETPSTKQLEISGLSNQDKGDSSDISVSKEKNMEHRNAVNPSLKPDLTIKIDIDQLTSIAIKEGFNPQIIGEHIISIANSELATNGVIAYSAIISKAIVVRKII